MKDFEDTPGYVIRQASFLVEDADGKKYEVVTCGEIDPGYSKLTATAMSRDIEIPDGPIAVIHLPLQYIQFEARFIMRQYGADERGVMYEVREIVETP